MQFLHQLECTDAKGKKSVISGARFVIAVGGRPSPLQVQICACASSILLPYSLNLFTSAFFPPSLLYLRGADLVAKRIFSTLVATIDLLFALDQISSSHPY